MGSTFLIDVATGIVFGLAIAVIGWFTITREGRTVHKNSPAQCRLQNHSSGLVVLDMLAIIAAADDENENQPEEDKTTVKSIER